jgi:hypothetical protein
MSRKTNSEELAVILARYQTHGKHFCVAAEDARDFVKIAGSLARLAEKQCNVGLTDRDEKRVSGLMNRIRAVLDERYTSEIVASFERDPRGYVVRLKFPNGENNTWTNDFGIG